MTNFTSFKLKLAIASVLALVATKYAKADVLVYEDFNYPTGVASGPALPGMKLKGQSGGIGMTGGGLRVETPWTSICQRPPALPVSRAAG